LIPLIMSLHFPHSITLLNMPILDHSLFSDHFISVAIPSGVGNLCHVLAATKQIFIRIKYTQVSMAIESLIPDGRAKKSD